MESFIFYLFAVVSIASALIVVSHRNPVVSALSLVLTLFSTAVLFILLLAHFIAVIQVLIYAGAIMVLFIFTVMFLNLRDDALSFDARGMKLKLATLFVILLIVGYFSHLGFKKGVLLLISQSKNPIPENFGTAEAFAEVLFKDYLLPFELTSILIVVAILGVVVIAKRRLN
ncbi:MAG: NADH dehydrogenase subunit J [Deltaproteobacteria bacterium]|nr:MAG: NADH dehydrogenase subunit J [Deltaproteobacteria bacterium]